MDHGFPSRCVISQMEAWFSSRCWISKMEDWISKSMLDVTTHIWFKQWFQTSCDAPVWPEVDVLTDAFPLCPPPPAFSPVHPFSFQSPAQSRAESQGSGWKSCVCISMTLASYRHIDEQSQLSHHFYGAKAYIHLYYDMCSTRISSHLFVGASEPYPRPAANRIGSPQAICEAGRKHLMTH